MERMGEKFRWKKVKDEKKGRIGKEKEFSQLSQHAKCLKLLKTGLLPKTRKQTLEKNGV